MHSGDNYYEYYGYLLFLGESVHNDSLLWLGNRKTIRLYMSRKGGMQGSKEPVPTVFYFFYLPLG